MWQRTSLSACNDRLERHGLCPGQSCRVFKLSSHLNLSETRLQYLEHTVEEPASQFCRSSYLRNLVCVFYLTQPCDQRTNRRKDPPPNFHGDGLSHRLPRSHGGIQCIKAASLDSRPFNPFARCWQHRLFCNDYASPRRLGLRLRRISAVRK